MTPIDEIKARLDLLEIVESYRLQARRSGKNFSALCPFHHEDTPSFVVFPDSQRWQCFGACNEGGDVFDFVRKQENWDFAETLRYLAQKAGVELRPATQEEQRHAELERQAEQVWGAAMAYFQTPLRLPPKRGESVESVGLIYARSRGWADETIVESGVGYFGKDWGGLREHLRKAGVDLECPAAVALVGYRGDVAAWGQKWGAAPAGQWVKDGKIPAMPPHLLVYPHLARGRVGYLAGRYAPEEFRPPSGSPRSGGSEKEKKPKSWNPPMELAGERQPYFNQVWWRRAHAQGEGETPEARQIRQALEKRLDGFALVVEGQGDAASLGERGLRAAAMAGCALPGGRDRGKPYPDSADNVLLSELKRKAGEGARILIGFSRDAAGEKGAAKLAAALLDCGLSALQIGIVRWPEHDANDWLKARKISCIQGVGDVLDYLDKSPTWLSELTTAARTDPATGQRDDEALRAVFAAAAGLEPFDVERAREEISSALDIRRRTFDTLLRLARREAGQTEDGQPRYFVEGGRILTRYYDQAGNEVVDALCNFTATITEDVLADNGQDVEREFRIAGAIGKRKMTTARVKAGDFTELKWVLKEWGSRAIIEAGTRKKDQLRAAIQHLSREVTRRTIYVHTGWREVDGKRIYLTAAGAIGGEEIEVDLDNDLELYAIPLKADDPAGAMRDSLAFLEVAPPRVAYPLWGAMFLAPLRELVNVAFSIWVFGASGTLKSTFSALALNHYGAAFDDKHLPCGFVDTANRIEHKAFVVKDAPLIVDDFAPQKDARSYSEYTQKAHRIVRDAGNLTGRGRLAADSSARTTYVPRSLVIITGEDLPESESLVARLFVVEVSRGDVNRELLTALQGRKSRLPHAMCGYLTWAAENWAGWRATLPERWRGYRQRSFGAGIHLRLPEAVAGLALGVEMGLRYAATLGVIGDEEYGRRMEAAWDALAEGARGMLQRVRDEKPEELFVRTIRELLIQGKIYLRARDGDGSGMPMKPMGGPEDKAEMLGWYDRDWLYLLPDASYGRVAKHFRDQGNVFPVREVTLRKMLTEAGVLYPAPDGHRTHSEYIEGVTQRVMRLKRTVFEDNSQTQSV